MIELVLVVTGLIAVSFICSLLESVILSLSRPYIQVLVDKKRRSGVLLKRMKEEIDSPIAAILTLNTISHTTGAALSGAIAIELFGSRWMGVFSAAAHPADIDILRDNPQDDRGALLERTQSPERVCFTLHDPCVDAPDPADQLYFRIVDEGKPR